MDSTQAPEQPGRRFRFRHGLISDVGLKREENQDSYGYAHTREASIFVVADGMGGARGGATASALAVNVILRYVFDEGGNLSEQTIRESVEKANEIIFNRSQRDESLTGMGTTAVILAFTGDIGVLGHVGDSRAYLFRDGSIKRLTRDHTLVQELVESGAIAPADAAHHPIAHMLTRSLGPAGAVEIDVAPLSDGVHLGDRFLLCCDGLYNLVQEDEMKEVVSSSDPEEATRKLLALAIERGASDNVTIQIVHVHDVNDESIAFAIPDAGKLRLVTSSEIDIDPLPSPPEDESKADTSSEQTMEQQSTGGADPKLKKKDRVRKKKRTKALDAVIFSDTPTLDDEVEAEDLIEDLAAEELPVEGAAGEQLESAETGEAEPSADELKSLQKLQRMALGVIFFTVGVIIVILVAKSNRGSSPQAILDTPMTLARQGSIPLPDMSTTSGSIPPSPSTLATTASSGGTLVDVTSTSEAPITTAAVESSGWPTLDITSESSEESSNLATDFGSVARKLERKDVESAVQPLLAFSVPPPPALKGISPDTSFVPINWEKEKLPEGTPPKFFTDAEKMEMTKRKEILESNILDTDAKLLALDAPSIRQLSEQEKDIDRELNRLQDIQMLLIEELREAKRDFSSWVGHKRSLANRDVLRIADSVAAADDVVKAKKAEYDAVLKSYRAALESFQKNQKDRDLIAKVSALGRELKAKRAFLEQSVIAGVDRASEAAKERVIDRSIELSVLELRIQQLNRHLGIVRGAQPNVSGRNRTVQEGLLNERAKMVEELRTLVRQFPEDSELEFRRELIAASVAKEASR